MVVQRNATTTMRAPTKKTSLRQRHDVAVFHASLCVSLVRRFAKRSAGSTGKHTETETQMTTDKQTVRARAQMTDAARIMLLHELDDCHLRIVAAPRRCMEDACVSSIALTVPVEEERAKADSQTKSTHRHTHAYDIFHSVSLFLFFFSRFCARVFDNFVTSPCTQFSGNKDTYTASCPRKKHISYERDRCIAVHAYYCAIRPKCCVYAFSALGALSLSLSALYVCACVAPARYFLEDRLYELRVIHKGFCLSLGMLITALCERDDMIDIFPHRLCSVLVRLDPAVSQQLRCEPAKQRTSLVGGATELLYASPVTNSEHTHGSPSRT